MFDYLINQCLEIGLKLIGLKRVRLQLESGVCSYLYRKGKNKNDQTAIVLLHGAGGESRIWTKFIQVFKTNKTVIIPDLLGHGESDQQLAHCYSITTQVAYLTQLLTQLNIKQIDLIGNSMGGAIALRYTACYPNGVSSLVLISAAGVTAKMTAVQQAFLAHGENLLAEINSVTDYKKMLGLNMHQPPKMPPLLLHFFTRIMAARKKINRKIFNDILQDLDQTAILSQIHVPTLIIWGEQDQILDPQNATLFAAHLPQSRLCLLPQVGHIPMLEKPAETAKCIADFLSAQD